MKYFKYFPTIPYDLDASGETKDIVDSFRFAKIINSIKDDITFYRFYDIPDGERPDHTSQTLYKTPDYYWSFFVANPRLKSLEDWPLAQADLAKKLAHDYTGNVINISTFDFFNKFKVARIGIFPFPAGVPSTVKPIKVFERITCTSLKW